MEFSPVPRRRPLSTPARAVLLLTLVLPVTVLTLVPAMFGLDRHVATSDAMAGSIERGSLVFARVVPVSDLEVGDVITFAPPAGAAVDGLVTHRIDEIRADGLRTRGDANPSVDPWVLPLDEPLRSRVVATVPYVGSLFTGRVDRLVWLALVLGAAGSSLVLTTAGATRRRRLLHDVGPLR